MRTEPLEKTVAAILLVALFAYAILFLHQPLLFVLPVLSLALVYLFWRLVRAAERIAAALEARNQ